MKTLEQYLTDRNMNGTQFGKEQEYKNPQQEVSWMIKAGFVVAPIDGKLACFNPKSVRWINESKEVIILKQQGETVSVSNKSDGWDPLAEELAHKGADNG